MPHKRLCILGLDGVSLPLAREISRLHKLENLGQLANAPQATTIASELPELSPVNWTSLYTAAGPEEHGTFGFTRVNPIDHSLHLADFSQVMVPTIFDLLGQKGIKSTVINLPNTYPARPIPGTLISGFPAPELTRAVFPPALLPELQSISYIPEADTLRGKEDHDFLLDQLHQTLQGRKKALNMLWPGDWQLFTFILTETDRLFHFLLDAVLDPEHPRHTACGDLLRTWDTLIGDFLSRYQNISGEKRLIVLADHGFTLSRTEVDINAFLKQHNWLTLHRAPENELDGNAIAPNSPAFALDPGRIYLQTATRFPNGQLTDTQAADLANRIRTALMALEHNGTPVMEAVYSRSEIYTGPYFDRAPDLVCLAKPGYDLKAKLDRTNIFSKHGRTGCHTATDALFYDTKNTHPHRLRDAGRLVLEWFD